MAAKALRIESKAPAVTLGFWVVKIAATTLGETCGDWVTMSLNFGYAIGSALFLAICLAAVSWQVSQTRFRPFPYWIAIVSTTTLGATLADLCDRSLGAGYLSGMLALAALLALALGVWRLRAGTIAVESVTEPRIERFYWTSILFSQTLGTALGDFTADGDLHGLGLGYERSALIFAGGLAVVALLAFGTRLSRAGLFWAAFILTRPLGATLGDLLDKPIASGGLNLDRLEATAVLTVFILTAITLLPQRAAEARRDD